MPGRGGAGIVWDGRPKWRNRNGGSGPARTVTALDVNGACLPALKTRLPIGALRYSAGGEYDRKTAVASVVRPACR